MRRQTRCAVTVVALLLWAATALAQPAKVVSPATDFSFDFQDPLLRPIK